MTASPRVPATGLRIFDGAVAIVTGAASGIGRALSEELARRGASVVLTDIDAEVHDVAGGMPAAAGRTASAAILDVTDYDGVQRLDVPTHGCTSSLRA